MDAAVYMEVCVHAFVNGDLRQDQEVLVKLDVRMWKLQSDLNSARTISLLICQNQQANSVCLSFSIRFMKFPR